MFNFKIFFLIGKGNKPNSVTSLINNMILCHLSGGFSLQPMCVVSTLFLKVQVGGQQLSWSTREENATQKLIRLSTVILRSGFPNTDIFQ